MPKSWYNIRNRRWGEEDAMNGQNRVAYLVKRRVYRLSLIHI